MYSEFCGGSRRILGPSHHDFLFLFFFSPTTVTIYFGSPQGQTTLQIYMNWEFVENTYFCFPFWIHISVKKIFKTATDLEKKCVCVKNSKWSERLCPLCGLGHKFYQLLPFLTINLFPECYFPQYMPYTITTNTVYSLKHDHKLSLRLKHIFEASTQMRFWFLPIFQ